MIDGMQESDWPTEVLDPSVLGAVRAMDPEFADEFIAELSAAYFESSAADLVRLRDASAVGADADVASAAHRLKSSSRSVGAFRLAAVCQIVESAARAGTLDDISGWRVRLEREHTDVLAALGAECAETQSC